MFHLVHCTFCSLAFDIGGGGGRGGGDAIKYQLLLKNQISDIRYLASPLYFFTVKYSLYQLIWMNNKKILSRYTDYLCLLSFKWRP